MPSINRTGLISRSVTRKFENNPPIVMEAQTVAGSIWEKNWVHTPNYRSLKASKQVLPDNVFNWQFRQISGGNAVFYDGIYTWTYSRGYVIFPPSPGSNILTNAEYVSLENSALANLLTKAKGNNWNVPVFVAEAGKTATMVYQRAHHLVSMAQALRSGNITRFFSLFHPTAPPPPRKGKERFDRRFGSDPRGAASSAWLEYTYGWTPFMLDVRSAVNTLMDVVDTPSGRVGRVVGTSEASVDKHYPNDIGYQQSPSVTYVQRRVTGNVSYRYVWYFKPTAADLPGRFGLTNPLEVAWELVPFSFVADWFLPIGDYLKALDAPFRFNHQGGTRGFRQSFTTHITPVRDVLWDRVAGGYGVSETTGVFRTPLTGIPMPSLNLLAFDPKIGVARAISSIALLRQQMIRLQKR